MQDPSGYMVREYHFVDDEMKDEYVTQTLVEGDLDDARELARALIQGDIEPSGPCLEEIEVVESYAMKESAPA